MQYQFGVQKMVCRLGPLWLRLMDSRTTPVPQTIGTSRQCAECVVPFASQECAPAGTSKVSGGRTAGTAATRAPQLFRCSQFVRAFWFLNTSRQDRRRRSVSLLPFC